ncbi:MAG: type II toxin-antitoxin system VapC family toxin [Gammaproteobacteria bacterium]|nr:type II toxin-antitoxin system VapC family toxin [Gammaproteobacteria bacterium]
MRILLDTHVWLWTQEAQERLGSKSKDMLLNEDNTLFISSISSLEIARLAWGGRLTLAGKLRTWVPEALQALHAETILITHEIALAAYELPGEFHRDTADRILVATAVVHDLILMTADNRILAYPHLLSYDACA